MQDAQKRGALLLIADNYVAHKYPFVQQWLAGYQRFVMRFRQRLMPSA
jgi:hypothetical protein